MRLTDDESADLAEYFYHITAAEGCGEVKSVNLVIPWFARH